MNREVTNPKTFHDCKLDDKVYKVDMSINGRYEVMEYRLTSINKDGCIRIDCKSPKEEEYRVTLNNHQYINEMFSLYLDRDDANKDMLSRNKDLMRSEYNKMPNDDIISSIQVLCDILNKRGIIFN